MSYEESVVQLNEVFKSQEDPDDFYKLLDKTLENLFIMGDRFRLTSFFKVVSLLAGDQFADGLFATLLNYDDNDLRSALKESKHLTHGSRIARLIAIYGPLLDSAYYQEVRGFAIKYSYFHLLNDNDDWDLQLTLGQNNGNVLTISDSPEAFIELFDKMLKALNLLKPYKELPATLFEGLKNQVKDL